MGKKSIELIENQLFNLLQRKEINKLKDITILGNGILIDKNAIGGRKAIEDYLKQDKIFSVSNSNNDVFMIADKLGEYIYKHEDLLDNFAICYIKNEYIERKSNINWARLSEEVNIKKIKLNKNEFQNINVDKINAISFDNDTYKKPKYAENKRFKNLLIKWYECCGLSGLEFENLKSFEQLFIEKDFIINSNSLEDVRLIPLIYVLHILDFCLSIYKLNHRKYDKSIIVTTPIYFVTEFNNGETNTKRYFNNIKDLILFKMIVTNKFETQSFVECLYCGEYTSGKSNKKFCNERCKKNYYYHKAKKTK